ncbi:MAG: galactose mutarotase [Eubacterium sp.]|nr:galactose mutarotase [Eubacterium sp.]
MDITRENFGTTKDGSPITAFTFSNGTIKARVCDYGAILLNLWVPDRAGNVADVVCGYDTAEEYFANPCNFGATIGPSANRIAGGEVPIDGVSYHMVKNEGENNLHTDADAGLHKVMWAAEEIADGVRFSIELSDGQYGLPGERKMSVSYRIVGEGGLRIEYDCSSDKKTLFNPTNHSYFNLKGAGDVLGHVLTLSSGAYTPVSDDLIPNGRIAPVDGTAFDFREGKAIGDDIKSENPMIQGALGFDLNYAVYGYLAGKEQKIATVKEPESGRVMEVYTDLPGVQLYTANYVDEKTGKGGEPYGQYCALCLETQYFPDSVHHKNFVSPLSESCHTATEYRFSAE